MAKLLIYHFQAVTKSRLKKKSLWITSSNMKNRFEVGKKKCSLGVPNSIVKLLFFPFSSY